MKFTFLEPLVEKALRSCEEAKKDDFILYLNVIELMEVDVNSSIKNLLMKHKSFKLPPFESVSRMRRKIQERNHELRDVQTYNNRQDAQQDYIDYALGDKQWY